MMNRATSTSVIVRGRVVATWSHKAKRKSVAIEVEPLGGWTASMRSAVESEARAVAHHLGVEQAVVTVSAPFR